MTDHEREPMSANRVPFGKLDTQNRKGIIAIVEESTGRTIIADAGTASALDEAEEALRLVECVNACEGMEDPALSIAALRKRIESLEQTIRNAGCDCKDCQQTRVHMKREPFTQGVNL